jgi:hypothetical protein
MSDRFGRLIVVVASVALAALRILALHGCADCGVPV